MISKDTQEHIVNLLAWRKDTINHYEDMVNNQKDCAKEKNFVAAKYFSQEAAFSLYWEKKIEKWIYELVDQVSIKDHKLGIGIRDIKEIFSGDIK